MTIGTYEPSDAGFSPYDPRSPDIALLLVQTIRERDARIIVDHIGSTSIPGCGGKGIIDLAVTYEPGNLEPAKAALDAMGFQRQTGRDPFPETRPMRIASVGALGGEFRVHAHVIERDGPEHQGLIAFRDTLRCNATLRRAYEQKKQQILANGITDSLDYCEAKGSFITATLSKIES
jgi:GrpB-like predicted nucleotidyltransferase (UPF0157 family)